MGNFLHAGDELSEKLMHKLRVRFATGKIEETKFKYIGFEIIEDSSSIILNHSEYMNKISNTTIDPKCTSEKEDLLNADEQTPYRHLVGQLNWAVQGSRPDIVFEMIDLSTKLKEGTTGDLSGAIKVVD